MWTIKIRKYFRGSGRVLAFVFIASVIWLLFDMAALRLSINDVNSQLLKELIVKEREAVKQQSTKRTVIHRGFKHPVQRVDLDLDNDDQSPVRVVNKVNEVYRKRPRKEPALKESKDAGDTMKLEKGKAAIMDRQVQVVQHHITSKWHVHLNTNAPAKKAVDLGVNRTKPEEKRVVITQSPKKVALPVSLNTTRSPPGVQEEKHVAPPSTSHKKLQEPKKDVVPQAKDVNTDSKNINVESNNEKAYSQTKNSSKHAIQPEKQDYQVKDKVVVEPSAKPVKQEAKPKEVINIKEDKRIVKSDVGTVKESLSLTETPNMPQKASEGKVSAVRRASVHRVQALDLTAAPRNSGAVGQFGHAAVVPSDKEQEVRRRWNEGHFNVFLSDLIPLDRAIPDTRPLTCSDNMVHDDLPTTSVIFCFVDEVWSTLLRSVHSVLNRSPPHLLQEVILVDDCSTRDYLKEQLDVYMSQFPKVRIIRLKERQGLIRARLEGAAVATGEVLTFLDSHIECNVGWLEPLLERVHLDRRKVACPVIEVISDKDMSYVLVDNFQRGIFKWPLVFGWSTLSEEYIKKNNMTDTDPIRCPVMAGGLFSINKKYFYELGTYDPGLDVWGGENMEISFKIWMCGGEIEIIPCSRVGHIFRGENPYKFPKDRQKTVERNLARVAEVWLDDHKDLFYGQGYLHLLDRRTDIGNLTEQIRLRERLQCNSFQWYLDNVCPELDAPLVKAEGLVFNRGLRKCLSVQKDSLLSFETCDLSKQSQHFNYTWVKLLRQQDVCVALQDTGPALQPCDRSRSDLRWQHKASNSGLAEHLVAENHPKVTCLEAGPKGDVHMSRCDATNTLQKWQFTHYYT
ncbi:polypeptide N-acetylgalactosaminyltransferase 5 [Osmerus eperlanus]|uniref:polypeptide N-acetylgalactosaminyltransferase 5 n=1 Tax=Osmerus eperlanus TaxID=29151 RepID=UPI002E1670A1